MAERHLAVFVNPAADVKFDNKSLIVVCTNRVLFKKSCKSETKLEIFKVLRNTVAKTLMVATNQQTTLTVSLVVVELK